MVSAAVSSRLHRNDDAPLTAAPTIGDLFGDMTVTGQRSTSSYKTSTPYQLQSSAALAAETPDYGLFGDSGPSWEERVGQRRAAATS